MSRIAIPSPPKEDGCQGLHLLPLISNSHIADIEAKRPIPGAFSQRSVPFTSRWFAIQPIISVSAQGAIVSAEVSIVPRLTVDIEVIQDPYDATLKAIEALRKSPSITGNLLDDEAVTVATGYRVCVERAKTSFQVAACQILLPFAVEAALCPFLSPLTEGSGGT